jgi:hypothetical protein
MISMHFRSSSGPIIATTQNKKNINVKGRHYTGWKADTIQDDDERW